MRDIARDPGAARWLSRDRRRETRLRVPRHILTVQPYFELLRRGRWSSSRRQLLGLGLLGPHPIGGLLGLAGSGEDGARVVLEHLQPGGYVGGVVGARMVRNAEVGEDQPAENLHGAFLGRVGGGSEAAAQITIEA